MGNFCLSGEAINRFDEDVGEVSDFPTWLPDQAGKWIAALIAVVFMAKINLTITLVIFLPLIGVSLITRWAWARIIYYRKSSGRANDIVNGFLVEIFGAVQALKIAAAEEHVAAHLQNLNQERAQVDIRHWTYRGLLQSLKARA